MKILRSLLLTSVVVACAGSAFAADREGVVASIKPIHSLVAAVMEGVGEPTLLVRGTGSAHAYSLRPSDAEAIEHAKVIFWAGPGMETFLQKPLETLATGAEIVTLEDAPGLTKLKFREGGAFEAHKHDDEAEEGHDHAHEEGHDGHGHAEGEGHAHDSAESKHDHAAEAGHEEGHEHHDHEAHGEYDLHFWLDPENAEVLVKDIAETLSESDPANAERYKSNAEAYSAKLDTLTKNIAAELAPVKDKPFIVFHDAYQYFEKRFGVNTVGSITVSPENVPGAQRVSEIREKVKQLGATCVFAEPQFEPRLVKTVTEGTTAKSGVLDPLGASLKDGPDLYPQLIRNLAGSLKACLSEAS
ncbi:zinc ABC transporter substrate-binding protein [Phyllobacterium phragmitis]|uniref:High-affinity zinc uptake system protein ZnuA n=1 Tax=Phyllobacterium phragmitis TaxID=2670329 RepID=A0A2S9IQ50_9HYPH|nr:zinc ABC transporter substrate-binding protein [Phyllobacterium phragmitis]PRD42643.1 zinc ABC transporter substrate-binding protein [Phyllobacterium phragmitis]